VLTKARIFRLRAGKSVAELSRETGVPVRALYRFERGQERLSPKHWERYCKALGVKPEDVLLPAPFEGWPRPEDESVTPRS